MNTVKTLEPIMRFDGAAVLSALWAFLRWIAVLPASAVGAFGFVFVVVYLRMIIARDVWRHLVGSDTFRIFEYYFFRGPGESPVWGAQGAVFVLIGCAIAPAHRPIVAAVLGVVCIAFTVRVMVSVASMSEFVPGDAILESTARIVGAIGAVVFVFLRSRPAADRRMDDAGVQNASL